MKTEAVKNFFFLPLKLEASKPVKAIAVLSFSVLTVATLGLWLIPSATFYWHDRKVQKGDPSRPENEKVSRAAQRIIRSLENERHPLDGFKGVPPIEKVIQLPEQKDRYQVALLMASGFIHERVYDHRNIESWKHADFSVAAKIQEFNLTPEQECEVAKACIKSNPRIFQMYSANFHLTPEQLYEVAQYAALNRAFELSDLWGVFYLDNNEKIERVLEIAASTPSILGQTSACETLIEKINLIDDPNRRLELALKFCQFYSPSIPDANLDLTEDQHLQLAAELFFNLPELLPDLLKMSSYSFLNQKEKRELLAFELAKKIVQKDKVPYELDFHKFNLSPEARVKIARFIAKNSPENLRIDQFFAPDHHYYHEIAALVFIQDQKMGLLKVMGIFHKRKDQEMLTRLQQFREGKLDPKEQSALITEICFEIGFSGDEKEWLVKAGLLKEFQNVRVPELRPYLFAQMQEIAKDDKLRSRYQEVSKGRPPSLAAVLVIMESQGVDVGPLLKSAKNKDDTKNQQVALVLSRFNDLNLTTERKNAIIKRLAEDKLFVSYPFLSALLDLERLDQIDLDKPLVKSLHEVFTAVVPALSKVEEFEKKWQMTIVTRFRSYPLLLSYAGKLASQPDHPTLIDAYGQFITEVLDGSFKESRYKYLEDQFSPEIFAAWKGASRTKASSAAKEDPPVKLDFRALLKEKIEQGHLNTENNRYSHLLAYLREEKSPEEALKALALERKGKEKKDDPELLLQINLIRLALVKDQGPDALKFLDLAIQALEKAHGSESIELLNDLNGWKKAEEEKQKLNLLSPKGSERTLVISDDPDDLFLCGTEVAGSCQRVNGNPKINKALVGYLLHGSTRLVAIKDSSGKIKGRAILRLMKEKDTHQPVLFLEPVYPDNLSEGDKVLLRNLANDLAQEMKIPLLSSPATSSQQTLVSARGGRAPYEYSDAGKAPEGHPRIFSRGEFEIIPAQL